MHYIRLTEHDRDDVMKFLSNDPESLESLMKTLHLNKDDAITFLKSILPEAVDSGISYLVKSDDHTVVAIRFSTIRTRDDATEDAQTIGNQEVATPLGQTKALLRHLNQQLWAELPPEINKVYYLLAVVVATQYRHTDLVDQLLHHNMDEIRTMGAQGLVADAAIFRSEALFHKSGYRIIAEVDRTAISSPGDGRKLSASQQGHEQKAQLVFKEIWRGECMGVHVEL